MFFNWKAAFVPYLLLVCILVSFLFVSHFLTELHFGFRVSIFEHGSSCSFSLLQNITHLNVHYHIKNYFIQLVSLTILIENSLICNFFKQALSSTYIHIPIKFLFHNRIWHKGGNVVLKRGWESGSHYWLLWTTSPFLWIMTKMILLSIPQRK